MSYEYSWITCRSDLSTKPKHKEAKSDEKMNASTSEHLHNEFCSTWSEMTRFSTPSMPSQSLTNGQSTPKDGQDKNIWFTSSIFPHPAKHNRASIGRIPRFAKFCLVGKRSLNIRQAKIETFNGTYLCQMNSKFWWIMDCFCVVNIS